MPTRPKSDFPLVHARLKSVLRRYEQGSLKARPNQPGNYVLVGPPTERSGGKDVWFGAVQTRKNYVAYHLMAVYAFPDLLRGMSPELKRRMQGKSCFNFRAVDEALFRELGRLTGRCYQRYRKEKLLR